MYLHVENNLSMCFEPRRRAENRNVCTLNEDGLTCIVFSDIWLLSHSTNIKTFLTRQWRQNVFCGRALTTIKWYQARILIPLHVKIWITSNTFPGLVRLTRNGQAKLRVTLRNLLARFSAKCNIDSKNQLVIDDRIYPTKKSLADIMAKYCVVFSQSPFEDLTAFRVRHVLLLISKLTSNTPGQWCMNISLMTSSNGNIVAYIDNSPVWNVSVSWWRHQMETFSALLAICAGNSPVTAEFPSQKPVTGSFYVSFDLRLNKRLNKQSRRWWFETLLHSFWRHCNALW